MREGERLEATENTALSSLPRCRGDTDYHSVGPRTLPAPGPKLSYYALELSKSLFIPSFIHTFSSLPIIEEIRIFENHSIRTLERNRSRCHRHRAPGSAAWHQSHSGVFGHLWRQTCCFRGEGRPTPLSHGAITRLQVDG